MKNSKKLFLKYVYFYGSLYLLCFVFLISLCFLPDVQASETKKVIVDGVGAIIGNDRARARDEAIRDAYRRAIEKGTGVEIEAETKMEMLIVLKDIVQARSSGYVRKWDITDEGVRDDNLYFVTITAEVVKGFIKKDDTEALKIIIDLMGNPRFMVLVGETNIGEKPPYSVLEAELTESMTGYGYHSIDPEQKKLIENTEQARKAKGGNNVEARELALRMQADVVIVGKVYTEKLPKNEYFRGTNWVSTKAYSSIKAIIAETGQILDVKSPQQAGTGLTYWDAGTKAIKQCGQDLANNLIWNIPLHIGSSQAKTIQVVVNNLSSSDFAKLAGKLRNLRNVTNVFPRGWEKDKPAIYDVKTTGSAEDLATRIEGLNLEIIRFNMNKIELIKKSWWKW
ncbi:MAG: hypothetical protein ACE5KZ_08640 [Candidatus Scalinduaceae bacterium]